MPWTHNGKWFSKEDPINKQLKFLSRRTITYHGHFVKIKLFFPSGHVAIIQRNPPQFSFQTIIHSFEIQKRQDRKLISILPYNPDTSNLETITEELSDLINQNRKTKLKIDSIVVAHLLSENYSPDHLRILMQHYRLITGD